MPWRTQLLDSIHGTWQVNFVGSVAAIRRALKEYATTLPAGVQADFEQARVPLDRLLELNTSPGPMNLVASGDAAHLTVVLMQSSAVQVQEGG